MSNNLIRSARAVLVLAVMLAVPAPQLYAIDSSNRYFAYGLGQRSCEDYVKFREKKLETLARKHERYTQEELYEIVEHWIAGFLTAHNLYVSDTYDVAGNSNMDDLKARLEKSCRANSKQYFAEAVITVVQSLHPQRVKADSGK
jgi:hypothetical protein